MTLPTVTLTGTAYLPTGAPAAGKKLALTLQATLRNDAEDFTVIPTRIEITLDEDGSIPADTTVVPSDADMFDPSPVSYLVRELFGDDRRYYVDIPAASDPCDLFALAPLDLPTTPVVNYASTEDITEAVEAEAAARALAIQSLHLQSMSRLVGFDGATTSYVPSSAGDWQPDRQNQIDASGGPVTLTLEQIAHTQFSPERDWVIFTKADATTNPVTIDTFLTSLDGSEDGTVTLRVQGETVLIFEASAGGWASLLGRLPYDSLIAALDARYEAYGAAAALVAAAPAALNTLDELAAALGDDANFAATVTAALAGKATPADITTALAAYATLASPALTGNPTAPTPTAGDNDTSIATTAFVATGFEQILSGTIDTATTGTLAAGVPALISASGGNVSRALPTNSPIGAQIIVGKSDSSANTVTATGKINGVSSTSVVLSVQGDTVALVSDGNAGWIVTGGGLTGAYDSRYQLAGSAVGSTLASSVLATSVATTSVGTTLAEINGSPLSIAPVLGSRAVDVNVLLCIQSGAAKTITVDVWDATAGAALAGGMGATVGASGFTTIYVSIPHNPGAGARTYRPRFKVDSGTATLTTYGANNSVGSRIWCVQR